MPAGKWKYVESVYKSWKWGGKNNITAVSDYVGANADS